MISKVDIAVDQKEDQYPHNHVLPNEVNTQTERSPLLEAMDQRGAGREYLQTGEQWIKPKPDQCRNEQRQDQFQGPRPAAKPAQMKPDQSLHGVVKPVARI